MTPSFPCHCCGKVEDLETIHPTGIHMDRAISWQCPCGNTRMVEITHRIPQELVRRAMLRDEMRDRFRRYLKNRQGNDAPVADGGVDEFEIPCRLCGRRGCSDQNPVCTTA